MHHVLSRSRSSTNKQNKCIDIDIGLDIASTTHALLRLAAHVKACSNETDQTPKTNNTTTQKKHKKHRGQQDDKGQTGTYISVSLVSYDLRTTAVFNSKLLRRLSVCLLHLQCCRASHARCNLGCRTRDRRPNRTAKLYDYIYTSKMYHMSCMWFNGVTTLGEQHSLTSVATSDTYVPHMHASFASRFGARIRPIHLDGFRIISSLTRRAKETAAADAAHTACLPGVCTYQF